MRFDFWCSRIPYIDHAAPVYLALAPHERGEFMVPEKLLAHATARGIPATVQRQWTSGNAIVVLSRSEFRGMPKRDIVFFVEHGVGPTYGNSHLSHRKFKPPPLRAILSTSANAEGHRRVYGDLVVEVGCPKLDAWYGYRHRRSRTPVVAFSHHWQEKAYPETGSAWPWDREAIESVVASGRFEVIGHKHPGDTRPIEEWWAYLGVEFVASFDEVMRRADLYVADNTSTLYEFAATDRPVVVLSPPQYRRDVDFGLRFWRGVPGVECAIAEHLPACIDEALYDSPSRAALRHKAVEYAYGPIDGLASQRAVEVLRNPPIPSSPIPTKKLARNLKPFEFAGQTWRGGDAVPVPVLMQMRDAGLIKGKGL